MLRTTIGWYRYGLFLVALISGAGLANAQKFRVQGVVVQQDTGFPVPNVVVHAHSTVRPIQPRQAPVFGVARTGNDGVFSIIVPSGKYTLCVSRADVYLDPCAWPDHSKSYEVAAAETADPVRMVLNRGRRVNVRLRGTRVQLANEVGLDRPPVNVRVMGGPGSVSREIPLSARFDSFVDFTTVIPQDPAFRISVASDKLQLTRQDGAKLSAGQNLLEIPSPSTAATFRSPLKQNGRSPESILVLEVTGRNP